MPAWKRAILSKQRERSRSQQQRKTTHYYDRDGRKVAVQQDDDENDNKRRGRRGQDDRRGRRKRSEDEGRRSGKGKRDDNKGKKDKSKGKKRGPTNIDDFDEDDYSDSENDSDSSEESGQKRVMTSEEAMKMLGTKWALGDGDDIEDLDERIKTQQLEIQRELSRLTQLQRNRGMKALPSLQQKVLQSDLQKLQAIQGKLKENPGVRELQMLLVGQQMILCDHVKEIQSSLGQRQSPPHSTLDEPMMTPATSASHLPPPPAIHQIPPPPPPPVATVFQPSYNPMQLAADQMMQNELIMAAEQQRRQQQLQLLAQQQRRQQQLLAAAQLSAAAGFGGLGMAGYSPLTPSVPLI